MQEPRHQKVLNATPLLPPALAVVLCTLVGGCSGKNAEKCEQAVSTARQAIAVEDFALARQWREYAWKQCKDSAELTGLDQQIVAKEGEVTQRRQAEEKRKAETEQLVKVFTQFVGDHRNRPETAAANIQCDAEPAPPAKKDERFCSGTRAVGSSYSISVRYFDADRTAARFVTRAPNPVSCSDLGPHNVVRTWEVPATNGRSAKRTHCEMTSGPMSGMHAMVSEAANADVHAFSPKYLERDPAQRAMVQAR
jgi:hypothetical protein